MWGATTLKDGFRGQLPHERHFGGDDSLWLHGWRASRGGGS